MIRLERLSVMGEEEGINNKSRIARLGNWKKSIAGNANGIIGEGNGPGDIADIIRIFKSSLPCLTFLSD